MHAGAGALHASAGGLLRRDRGVCVREGVQCKCVGCPSECGVGCPGFIFERFMQDVGNSYTKKERSNEKGEK